MKLARKFTYLLLATAMGASSSQALANEACRAIFRYADLFANTPSEPSQAEQAVSLNRSEKLIQTAIELLEKGETPGVLIADKMLTETKTRLEDFSKFNRDMVQDPLSGLANSPSERLRQAVGETRTSLEFIEKQMSRTRSKLALVWKPNQKKIEQRSDSLYAHLKTLPDILNEVAKDDANWSATSVQLRQKKILLLEEIQLVSNLIERLNLTAEMAHPESAERRIIFSEILPEITKTHIDFLNVLNVLEGTQAAVQTRINLNAELKSQLQTLTTSSLSTAIATAPTMKNSFERLKREDDRLEELDRVQNWEKRRKAEVAAMKAAEDLAALKKRQALEAEAEAHRLEVLKELQVKLHEEGLRWLEGRDRKIGELLIETPTLPTCVSKAFCTGDQVIAVDNGLFHEGSVEKIREDGTIMITTRQSKVVAIESDQIAKTQIKETVSGHSIGQSVFFLIEKDKAQNAEIKGFFQNGDMQLMFMGARNRQTKRVSREEVFFAHPIKREGYNRIGDVIDVPGGGNSIAMMRIAGYNARRDEYLLVDDRIGYTNWFRPWPGHLVRNYKKSRY